MSTQLDRRPQLIWSKPTNGFCSGTTPALGYGALFYIDATVETGAVLRSLDIHSRVENWSVPLGSLVPNGAPLITQEKVWVADGNGELQVFDRLTGAPLLQAYTDGSLHSQPVLSGDRILFADRSGYCHALNSDGSYHWHTAFSTSQTPEATLTAITVIAGRTIVLADLQEDQGRVLGIDVASGEVRWTFESDTSLCAHLHADGKHAYVGRSDGSLLALDLSTGELRWSFQASGPVVAAVTCGHGTLFCATVDGTLYTVNSKTGEETWSVRLGIGTVTTPILADGRVAFFGTTTGLYAMDTVTHQYEVFTSGAPAISLPAVENAMAYFLDGGESDGRVVAVSFAGKLSVYPQATDQGGIAHKIMMDSQLMVGTYSTSSSNGAAPIPQNASYQSHLSLVDQQRVARRNQPLKFWALAPCTVTSGGATYSLDTDTFAWLTTDGSGKLALVVDADTRLTMPTLQFWGNFMPDGAAVMVFPDQAVTPQLATMQSSQLDPSVAKAYDGSPLLSSGYQDPTNRGHVASAFQNIIGGQTQRLALWQQSNPFTHGSVGIPGIAYVAPGAPAVGLEWSPGTVPNFQISISSGAFTFAPLSQAEAATHMARLRTANDIWGDFEDFVDDIVSGAENVVNVVVQTVESAADIVVQGVTKAYQFTIDTILKAGAVLAGIIKMVATLVERIIEFLSFLFGWGDIIRTHDLIVNTVQENFGRFKQWAAGATTEVENFLQGMEGQLESQLQAAIQSLTGTTVGAPNNSYNDPQPVYNAGGQQHYAKAQWLPNKIGDSVDLHAALRQSMQSSGIIDTFATFFFQMESVIQSQFPTLGSDVTAIFQNFQTLFSDPATFVTRSVSEFMQLVYDICVTLLKLAVTAVGGFLQMMISMVDSLLDAFGASIDIPFVSWLYKLLTGDDLSMLDLIALVIAIPGTVIAKSINAFGDAADGVTQVGASANLPHVLYTVDLLYTTAFDGAGIIAQQAQSGFLTGATAILICISQGLGFPAKTYPSSDPWGLQDYIPWTLGFIPCIGACLDVFALNDDPNPLVVAWRAMGTAVLCGYGLGMIALYSVWSQVWSDYMGNGGKVLVQNLFSVLSYPFSPMKLADLNIPLGAITVICDGVNMGMSFQYVTD